MVREICRARKKKVRKNVDGGDMTLGCLYRNLQSLSGVWHWQAAVCDRGSGKQFPRMEPGGYIVS